MSPLARRAAMPWLTLGALAAPLSGLAQPAHGVAPPLVPGPGSPVMSGSDVGVPGPGSAPVLSSGDVGVPGSVSAAAASGSDVGVPGSTPTDPSSDDGRYVGVPNLVPMSDANAPGSSVSGVNPATNESSSLEAPEVTDGRRLDATKGMMLGYLGAQTNLWRPMPAGITNGYDVVFHSDAVIRRKHLVGRHRMNAAFGAGSGGFEGQFHWLTSLGLGTSTTRNSLAYARVGIDWRVAGSSDVRTNLLSPLLEIGHFWSESQYHLDAGLRVDTALLGGIYVLDSGDRFRHRADLGGYANASAGPLVVDVALEWRRLRQEGIDVLHTAAGVCGGGIFLACTRVNDYWLEELDRHVTQVTLSVGLGYLLHGQ